jgi:hypothetical protein
VAIASHEAPIDEPVKGRVVEWFRTGLRRRIASAVIPALVAATLGWLLLVLGARLIGARAPEATMLRRATLPAAAVVDADGHPAAPIAPSPLELMLLLGGGCMAMASPFFLVFRLFRKGASSEAELLLRTDGLVLRAGEEETTVPWEEVEEVIHRPRPGTRAEDVLLVRHDGTEVVLDADFDGVDASQLVLRIRSVRNRALFGLLEPQTWPERAPSASSS